MLVRPGFWSRVMHLSNSFTNCGLAMKLSCRYMVSAVLRDTFERGIQMRKLALAAVLASSALATPALARDNSWYIGIDSGVTIVEDQDITFTPGIDPTTGLGTASTTLENVDYHKGWTVMRSSVTTSAVSVLKPKLVTSVPRLTWTRAVSVVPRRPFRSC